MQFGISAEKDSQWLGDFYVRNAGGDRNLFTRRSLQFKPFRFFDFGPRLLAITLAWEPTDLYPCSCYCFAPRHSGNSTKATLSTRMNRTKSSLVNFIRQLNRSREPSKSQRRSRGPISSGISADSAGLKKAVTTLPKLRVWKSYFS